MSFIFRECLNRALQAIASGLRCQTISSELKFHHTRAQNKLIHVIELIISRTYLFSTGHFP
jgi:hypothetical protein